MSHKAISLILTVSIFCFSQSFAQNEIDALRYGMTSPGATARSIALGGTGGSTGGDFSSISINPAGVGVYRHSKLMLTPNLRFNNNKSLYLNNSAQDHHTKFNLSNIGIVLAHEAKGREYEQKDWKSYAFAIGYNRLADFNNHVSYSGSNNFSSITEVMSKDAINYGTDDNIAPPFGYFGWNGFLLYDDLTSIPKNTILDNGGSLRQTKHIRTKGGIGDWSFSFGGNYKEKLMLGMSLDLLSYKYDRDAHFIEQDETGNPDNDFDFLDYHEKLLTTGFGVNLKFGLIYAISNSFRIGAAIHTPTWNTFTDKSRYDLTTNTENLKARTGQEDVNPKTVVNTNQDYLFDYSLRTPWRGVLSATLFLGHHGFITADYSYVDYASMRYDFGPGYEQNSDDVNHQIKNTFQGGHNIRVGIEGKLDKLYGRLGYAYHSSPFQRANDFGGDRMDFSAGIGVRFDKISLDLAYRYRIYNTAQYAYPLLASGVETGLATIRENKNLIALTFGVGF